MTCTFIRQTPFPHQPLIKVSLKGGSLTQVSLQNVVVTAQGLILAQNASAGSCTVSMWIDMIKQTIYGPRQAKKCLPTCTKYAGSDHAQSIIRAFALHSYIL